MGVLVSFESPSFHRHLRLSIAIFPMISMVSPFGFPPRPVGRVRLPFFQATTPPKADASESFFSDSQDGRSGKHHPSLDLERKRWKGRLWLVVPERNPIWQWMEMTGQGKIPSEGSQGRPCPFLYTMESGSEGRGWTREKDCHGRACVTYGGGNRRMMPTRDSVASSHVWMIGPESHRPWNKCRRSRPRQRGKLKRWGHLTRKILGDGEDSSAMKRMPKITRKAETSHGRPRRASGKQWANDSY